MLVFITCGFAGDLASESKTDEFFLFLGRFHPMILHFPIGVLNILLILELYIWFRKAHHLKAAAWILLIFGMLTAIKAAVLGLFLSWGGGYDPDLLFWHKWLGISVAVLSVVAVFLRWKHYRNPEKTSLLPYRLSLLLCIAVMALAGHDGASLTHGSNYLFKYAPQWVKELFGQDEGKTPSVKASSDHVFTKTIHPIFEAKCISCHGPEKQKGKYRLDIKAHAFKGGESGLSAIVPGKPMESYLVELILLPEHADEVMPPAKKTPLTKEEVIRITQWIYDGAEWPETQESPTTPPKEVKAQTPSKESEEAKLKEAPAEMKNDKENKVNKQSALLPETNGKVDFVKHILPILEDRCFSCHGEKKQKGDLRLDSPEWIKQGGESGEDIIIPGKPEKSSFYVLTTLDEDDDDIMPPKKGPLTQAQQNAIRDWIAQGANYGSWSPKSTP